MILYLAGSGIDDFKLLDHTVPRGDVLNRLGSFFYKRDLEKLINTRKKHEKKRPVKRTIVGKTRYRLKRHH